MSMVAHLHITPKKAGAALWSSDSGRTNVGDLGIVVEWVADQMGWHFLSYIDTEHDNYVVELRA